MYIKKSLRNKGIIPLRELNDIEKKNLIDVVSDKITKLQVVTPKEYNSIVLKMLNTPMYLTKMYSQTGNAFYFNEDLSLYFDETIDFANPDEYALHECIYCMQDKRELDTKQLEEAISGINEAFIQYTVARMLGRIPQSTEYNDIKLKTLGSINAPLLCSLSTQIAYFIDDKTIINSVLNKNENLKNSLSELLGRNTLIIIENNLNRLLEIENEIDKCESEEKIIELKKEQQEDFMNIQTCIMKSCFGTLFTVAQTRKELESYSRMLNNYRDLLGITDNYEFYERYCEEKQKRLSEELMYLPNEEEQNKLAVINNNKIVTLFRKVRNFIHLLIN